MHESFHKSCPIGKANRQQFEQFYKDYYQNVLLTKRMNGNKEKKLRWMLTMYDLDDDSIVKRAEMYDIHLAAYKTTPRIHPIKWISFSRMSTRIWMVFWPSTSLKRAHKSGELQPGSWIINTLMVKAITFLNVEYSKYLTRVILRICLIYL